MRFSEKKAVSARVHSRPLHLFLNRCWYARDAQRALDAFTLSVRPSPSRFDELTLRMLTIVPRCT